MRIFFTEQIKIHRLKTTSGNMRQYCATATADCSLQPLGKDASQISDGVFGSGWVAYVDSNIPVMKGDRVQDKNGVIYNVSDVVVRDYGMITYKAVSLKRT